MKGKILNVERARFDKMLASVEIGTMITALGTGIGPEEFNLAKLRYHKIVIMTDADVDGSHIRTLLLTFFYRQMRPLIENGYLYIAQPPLYKLQRGSSEVYLKDEHEFENYLLDAAAQECSIKIGKDSTLTGEPLKRFTEQAIKAAHTIGILNKKVGSTLVLEAILATNGWETMVQPQEFPALIQILTLHDIPGVQWRITIKNDGGVDGLSFERRLNGVREEFFIDANMCNSLEAKSLSGFYHYFIDFLTMETLIETKKKDTIESKKVFGLSQLVNVILQVGRHGMTIKRFKGLGEMLPEQLWETTLNPDARTLLQVQLSHLEEAEKIFSTLMGDMVEPRRDFIQTNALKVVNLDA